MAGINLTLNPSEIVQGAAKAKSALDTIKEAVRKAETELKALGTQGGTAVEIVGVKAKAASVQTVTAMQAAANAFAGVIPKATSAAAAAEAFGQALDQRAAVDRLLAGLDPLYAATQRYERSVEQVQAAQISGAVTNQQAVRVLNLLDVEYQQASTAAGIMANSVARGTPAFGGMATGARLLGMQLSQVGQQTMASGNFIQALDRKSVV